MIDRVKGSPQGLFQCCCRVFMSSRLEQPGRQPHLHRGCRDAEPSNRPLRRSVAMHHSIHPAASSLVRFPTQSPCALKGRLFAASAGRPNKQGHEVSAKASGKDQDPDNRGSWDETPTPRSSKGGSFEKQDRRKGRPAHLRSPDDTPLRDANRDVMLGVLTARAARTLVVYLQETNLNVCQWLVTFMHQNPITLQGSWEDISGDTFLRKLLSMPIEEAKWDVGCDPLHNNSSTCGVDPRSIAQRILDIRTQISKELIQDLGLVPEDNNELLRQSLRAALEGSFKLSTVAVAEGDGPCHPELSVDDAN